MNENDAQRLLDDLLDTVPDHPAPLAGLVQAGDTARRSRRRRMVAGAAALVAVAAISGALVPRALTKDAASTDDPTTAVPTTSPTSQPVVDFSPTYVGLGRVVVDLPADWARGCRGGSPVFTVTSHECGQAYTLQGESVSFAPLDSDAGAAAAARADDEQTINGIDVIVDARPCATGTPGLGGCSTAVVVPSEHVVVTISAETPQIVGDVRDSLRVLPSEYTTVPYLGDLPRDLPPLDDVLAALRDAGLVAVADGPGSSYVNGVDPAPGTVLAVRSAVGLSTTPYRKGPPSAATEGAAPPLLDGTYRTDLPGAGDAGTLTLQDGALTGDDGCNSLFGSYVQDGADVTFPRNDLGSTLVGCGDEPDVIGTLLRVRHVTAGDGGDRLRLHAEDGTIVLDLMRIG
ncbi:hypothetical protein BH11ACT8_BH11ACT8_33290 [soil metagenome]